MSKMTVSKGEALETIRAIAEDVLEERGCPLHDVPRWAAGYPAWRDARAAVTAAEMERAIYEVSCDLADAAEGGAL